MFDYKAALIQDIVEQFYKEGEAIDPKKLLAALDSEISSYELVEMLCTFINSMAKISRKKDVSELCLLKQQVQSLMEQNQYLEKHQARLLRENLGLQRKYSYLKSAHDELGLENVKLKGKVEAKEQALQVYSKALQTRS